MCVILTRSSEASDDILGTPDTATLLFALAVRGRHLSVATIAAHLTGRTRLGEPDHNVIAKAINARLAELARPPRNFPYR